MCLAVFLNSRKVGNPITSYAPLLPHHYPRPLKEGHSALKCP